MAAEQRLQRLERQLELCQFLARLAIATRRLAAEKSQDDFVDAERIRRRGVLDRVAAAVDVEQIQDAAILFVALWRVPRAQQNVAAASGLVADRDDGLPAGMLAEFLFSCVAWFSSPLSAYCGRMRNNSAFKGFVLHHRTSMGTL